MMSFSSGIKELICKTKYRCPGCMRAELAGFFVYPDKLSRGKNGCSVSLPEIGARIADAVRRELGVDAKTDGKRVAVSAPERVRASLSDDDVINDCCKTAFLRGAFLSCGSVNDPRRGYHLEFAAGSETESEFLSGLLKEHGFHAKTAVRKGKPVVYIKESAQIADLVGYLTDGRAGLEIMSMQVEKELKSSTQRRVNCDSANLTKQSAASARQITAIRKLKAANRWAALPEVLREIGELRLQYPDVSIEELGTMTEQRIGKSGVNHRLKRIIDIAESIGAGERSGK